MRLRDPGRRPGSHRGQAGAGGGRRARGPDGAPRPRTLPEPGARTERVGCARTLPERRAAVRTQR
eukprot:2720103-Prymnesium_polylepis.1